jgi:hypothetical protein
MRLIDPIYFRMVFSGIKTQSIDISNKGSIPNGVTNFFEEILDCEISEIEIINTVEQLTDNFDLRKLEILYKSFEFFLCVQKDEKEAEYTQEEIQKETLRLGELGKEIPRKKSQKIHLINEDVQHHKSRYSEFHGVDMFLLL